MQEKHFKILRALDADPHLSQREISRKTGISLGQVNYCLNALAQKGWVKIGNFTRSTNKKRYAYILTPEGLEQKAKVTYHFLRCKMQEYEKLQAEIDDLRNECDKLAVNGYQDPDNWSVSQIFSLIIDK